MLKKKKVDTTKKEKKIDNDIIKPREKRLIKFAALLSAFFASGMAILIFVFGVISTISGINLSKEALINNNIVRTFISKLNGYTILETKDIITLADDRLSFIIFEIVIPAIAFIGTMILIIILAKRAIDFISDVTDEKSLYNTEKLKNIRDIISILSVILLATLVIFNNPSIIIYILILSILWLVYLLFKRCVLLQKK